jgi:hypothetical protein
MRKVSFTSTSSVVRTKEILSAEVGNEVVLMSIDKGVYYGLNPVGARVWTLLGEPVLVNEMCEQIVDEFEVTLEQCQEEVLGLLKDMQEQGLIQIVDEGSSDGR